MILRIIVLMLSIVLWSCHSPDTAPPSASKATPQAPPLLQIAEWIKGEPVDLSEGLGKNVYLIEFWATWCPPCRRSIPHLTELQKQYKDKGLVIIGISTEDPDTVTSFIERMGNQMDYRVAVDLNGETAEAYMEANGVNSIPHAFLIEKSGEIIWHGNPLDDLDEQLARLLR